ncbi:lytic transglycosylase domain-containing protein [Nitratireductor sp. ZSWI3]|uniref:lytic transglycosylase domain-containing protein n=1 Tax=Nitratireductor sp. ZSWI3 TaxID=2966359 RepID=UPI0021503F2F|nr:lytic transglycosylase domain-containing protein [Nitratireductor sp. ZSWI3]MCR4267922.1 lytic transglycosylase domain-containing protein [Nitratireductor sp. ZSWI3]
MKPRFALAALLFALPVSAAAQALPDMAPIPFARPNAAAAPQAAIDQLTQTATVRPDIDGAVPGLDAELSTLMEGLDAVSRGDLDMARQLRDRSAGNRLDRRILSWAIALSGDKALSSAEIARTSRELAGWPGMEDLRANAERALFRERPSPETVIEILGNSTPKTYEGAVALARAHLANGRRYAARAVLSPRWRTHKLEAAQEVAFIREFGELVSKADHRFRMERMLYEDRVRSAERVAGLAGAEALADAWAAVIRGEKTAGKLLDAVPAAQRSAGYIFAKARHLRRRDRYREAATVMLTAPRDAAALVDPDEWWIERRALSRELLDIGDAKTAYRIAAAHAAESPARAADAEFHAGWYALQALKDPRAAARHFARIAEIAEGPISNARAYYWLGRAAEAGGPGEAAAYFAQAAAYGTAFYGQLAAARIGRTVLAATYPEASTEDRRAFSAREVVRAIKRLEQTSHAWRAARLYRDLAGELTSPGELALLAAMAEQRGDHMQALRVGKIAAARGIGIGALAHPLGAIPAEASLASARQALAYAVARQETEFNGTAVSPAGARGLLQLMPRTAQEMARKSGLPYSRDRLTQDTAYNARLGAAYLDEQLRRFGGSYVLTFAGYNAGPRRAAEWIERYGDPRGKPIDEIVDWIERIPYSETRNYVQRVMENYQVYKMRLSGRFDIAGDLAAGG